MINLPDYLKLAHITYDGMCEQERTGILFDKEKAEKLIPEITKQMEGIELDVEPKLPKRQPNAGELKKMTPPKQQFKKDGTPSKRCLDWFDQVYDDPLGEGYWFAKHNGVDIRLPHHEPIVQLQQMKLGNGDALKDWLLSLGWQPLYYNFKQTKNKFGKMEFVKDERGRKIKTSPKLQENGKICPGLSRLASNGEKGEAVALVPHILKFLTLRHRRSQIQGWLDNPRLAVDGRLPAGASGLTNTKRQKHKTVVNVPRVGSVYGAEMRSLFTAEEGKVIVGWDASSLEDRVKAHYLYPIDGGVLAAKVIAGEYEPHQESADVWGMPRSRAKSGNYALQYLCMPPTLAKTLGCSVRKAEGYWNDYWELNSALAEFIKRVERAWERNNKKYVLTIDGSKIYTRAKHSVGNCVMQSTGAKIMDMSYAYMRKWVRDLNIPCKRVAYFHDEYQYEAPEDYAEQVGELGVRSIIKAGEYFKLNVPMDAEYKIGNNFAETH